jgi:hypothetical protein
VREVFGYLRIHLVDFYESCEGGNAIQGDLYAIICNPIASTILKRLRFKFKIFRMLSYGLGLEIKAYILPNAVKVY